ncbi:MAG TPA: tetratricopeptide repeat protein, partial [Chromatiales bacterium]|nr:tetratricopeptide repeat protein [Chromatiales bacterium]
EKEAPRPSPATRYGYALALLKTGDYGKAFELTSQLAQQDPDRIAYQIHLARIKLAAGHADEAQAIFRDNLALYPNNRPLTLLYANALIQTGNPLRATRVLRNYKRERKQASPLYYSLLAQAENDNGNEIAAHQALAEYYDLVGQTASAISQLKIALKDVEQDSLRHAQIKARLKVLKEQLRQEEDH